MPKIIPHWIAINRYVVQLKMRIIDQAQNKENKKIKKVNLIIINVLRLGLYDFKSVIRGPRGAREDILRTSVGVF